MIEVGYNRNDGKGMNMSKIQEIFFDNLKQIFNSYNRYFENILQEKKSKLIEIEKRSDEVIILILI
jgi:hypothetical protein